MNQDSVSLDYLTVDSIQWATGDDRPRMTLADKRAKHRVHQRHFMLRQRERLEELRREVRCRNLQLLRLQAAQASAILQSENDLLRHQIQSNVSVTVPQSPPTRRHSCSAQPESLSVDTGDNALFELLTMLPEIQATTVVSGDAYGFAWNGEQGLAPLAWQSMTAWSMSIASPVV